MSDHHEHGPHEHVHGDDCGHTRIRHGDHFDHLHDGHLHSKHGDHYDEHSLDVNDQNPDTCTPDHACSDHDASHVHGEGCGHEAVPHGDHTDYLVGDHLHHVHGDHCDDHGKVEKA